MDGPMSSSLVETLDTLEDPRVDRTKLHNLTDILVLSVMAVICGADRLCGSPGSFATWREMGSAATPQDGGFRG